MTISRIERILTLRSVDCFSDLPLDRIAAIARSTSAEKVWPGATLHPVRETVFVCEGTVAFEASEGPESRHGPGAVIGLTRMLAERPARPIRAIGPAALLLLGADALEDLCLEEFDVVETLLRWLSAAMLRTRAALPPGTSIAPTAADSPDLPPPNASPFVRRLAALAGCGLIPSRQADALAELAHQASELELPADTRLWDVGEESGSFLLLVRGEIHCEAATGWHVHAGPNCLIGDVEALAEVPRAFRATTVSAVRALEIPTDGFLDILEDHPRLAIDFLALLAARAADYSGST